MLIYGVDFTSAPGPYKAQAVAQCRLDGAVLRVTDLLRLHSFEQLELSLRREGEWVVGFDFPFGLPRRLLENLDWPRDWSGYVARVGSMTRRQFEDLLEMYKASRSAGDKEHRRRTDRLAGAVSPMKLYGVPVAKMFFEGAPRLLEAPADIRPCRPTDDPRVAVEAYPALVARAMIGKRSYKGTTRRKVQAKRDARRKILTALTGEALEGAYGLRVEAGHFLTQGMVDDERADLLDAVLAAVQAAWAWTRRGEGWGVPAEADPAEGWIVDPATLERARRPGW